MSKDFDYEEMQVPNPPESSERPLVSFARQTAECSDVRNAERFAVWFSKDVRYAHSWELWLCWDGKRWSVDNNGGAKRFAIEAAQRLLAEKGRAYQDAIGTGNKDKIDAARIEYKWASRTQNSKALNAMLEVASASKALTCTHRELDTDPWLLNVSNGVLDLRTGTLREHRREDLISKLAPVVYDPRAKAPTWERFLSQAMGGNAEMIAFLRRMIGYTLTGLIREHILGFNFGGGANGKSTFLTAIHALLGDYAVRAPRGLLFKAKGGDKHPTEMTTLFGARFVSCAEVGESEKFDEALVKDLTGGDKISARRMREDFWEFTPTHKLFLAGNHRPSVSGTDEGIWRRIRLVPWTVTVAPEERDAALGEKLTAELSGILNWALEGCLEWQRDGIGEPIEVTEATAEYRDESDPLKEFLDRYCVFEPGAKVARKWVREKYVAYCSDNGREPVQSKRFAQALQKRGAANGGTIRIHEGVRDAWTGVRLKSDEEHLVGSSENCRDKRNAA